MFILYPVILNFQGWIGGTYAIHVQTSSWIEVFSSTLSHSLPQGLCSLLILHSYILPISLVLVLCHHYLVHYIILFPTSFPILFPLYTILISFPSLPHFLSHSLPYTTCYLIRTHSLNNSPPLTNYFHFPFLILLI